MRRAPFVDKEAAIALRSRRSSLRTLGRDHQGIRRQCTSAEYLRERSSVISKATFSCVCCDSRKPRLRHVCGRTSCFLPSFHLAFQMCAREFELLCVRRGECAEVVRRKFDKSECVFVCMCTWRTVEDNSNACTCSLSAFKAPGAHAAAPAEGAAGAHAASAAASPAAAPERGGAEAAGGCGTRRRRRALQVELGHMASRCRWPPAGSKSEYGGRRAWNGIRGVVQLTIHGG